MRHSAVRSAVVPGGRCEAADCPETLGRRGGQLRAAAALENDLFSTKPWPSIPSPAYGPVAPSRCWLAMAVLAQTAAPEPLRCSSPSQTCQAPGMAAVRAAVHLPVCMLYGVPRLALICLRSSMCSCPDQPEARQCVPGSCRCRRWCLAHVMVRLGGRETCACTAAVCVLCLYYTAGRWLMLCSVTRVDVRVSPDRNFGYSPTLEAFI